MAKLYPLISVIVLNYNHAPYLEKRIGSVLDQTFQDFELILLDDCSTDSNVIINECKKYDKDSQVFLSKSNSGSPFGLWEYGITKARVN
ncbi:MAG: glycosyltransferase family 2 protein [Paludibacter sp.]|uniref:Glycosyl transferase family 2 n=1 Tax=Flavobacterium frigoris TaxID=229204 RepID=A0A1H9QYV4_FLAFI|nr:glycosyltransferase family A protein [Flavobacterium frigoris]NDP22919.1 glycosyltransferase family 2 protein [Paludibacter sp.]SER65646.1 Glycosyl transferase family 2 [Flavobacterium frigoris]